MIEIETLSPLVAELRRNFDASFAESRAAVEHDFEDLISIGVGSDPFVVRLNELAGLYVDRTITPVPSAMNELLGISDFRGELVAVYDLRGALGYPKADTCRFMLRVARRPLGFAFDRLLGHARVKRADLAPVDTVRGENMHGQVSVAGKTQPIVDLHALASKLERQAASALARES